VAHSERPPLEGEAGLSVIESWPAAHKALFYQKVDKFYLETRDLKPVLLSDKAARVLSLMHEQGIKGSVVCVEPGDKLSNLANVLATLIAVRRRQLRNNADAFLQARAALAL
jgi:hypothetical protein